MTRKTARTSRAVAQAVMTATLVAFVCVAPGGAHNPVTSPYTYNEDVFPILRERCGQCHMPGGVAPMSLLTATDAVSWGGSIRAEVLAGHMPPGGVDEAPARFRNAAGLSPREMNLLLTWLTGGTPPGNRDKDPAPVTRERSWPLGAPDLVLPLPSEAVLAAGTHAQTSEFVIPTGVTEPRWIRAVDLLPGNAAMVRAAMIAVRSPAWPGTGGVRERTLALWVPGEQPNALDAGLGFELPASADLVVRVLYRKTWEYERQELRDRSTIGLYFAADAPRPVQSVRLAPDAAGNPTGDRIVFRRILDEDTRAIAIYPEVGLDNTAVKVSATRPDGTRTDLIAFHPRPDWTRRYWFREPIALPAGTTIQVTASMDDHTKLLPFGLAPASSARPDLASLRLTLNVIR
jgi:hypothetical protein